MSSAHPETAGTGRAVRFLTASLARELGILLLLSAMFPFMVHVLPVPGDARIGARLLPMFYAPLLAALIGRPQTAWTLALGAPWLNWALTSHPAPPGATVLMLELIGFVVVIRTTLRRSAAGWFVAVPAYFTGKLAAVAVTLIAPRLIGGRPPLAWAVDSTIMALPGILILVLITGLVLRHYPPGPGGGGPTATA